MKKLCTLIILTLFCLSSVPVLAAEESDDMGFWFEAGAASGKNHASWVTGYWDHSFTDSIGVYALVDTESDGYREFYAGPKVKLTEWLEVGVAVGRESIRGELRNSARRNAFVSVNTDKVSAYATYENGASGPWHKAYALYKVTDSVSAGAMYETTFGRGIRFDYNVKKNVTVWAASLRKDDEKNPDKKVTTTLLAANFSF